MIEPTTAIAAAPPHEIELYDPPFDAIYTIEATAHFAGVPRRTILVYCKHQLLSPEKDAANGAYSFNRDDVRTLRRIDALRAICGDDLAGIKIILDLTDALERLQSQLRARSQKPAAKKSKAHDRHSGQPTSSRKTKPKVNLRRKRK